MRICESVQTETHLRPGIGTYQEKTLHWILKKYFSDDPSEQEVSLCGFVADIYDGHQITEIQTSGLSSMKKKLEAFLSFCPVTIVYPVAGNKRVFWIDPVSGETSEGRRSPRRGIPADVIPEMVFLLPYLLHPGLTIRTVVLDLEEYRMLDGRRSADRKRGSSRLERVPVDITAVYDFCQPNDFLPLIPFSPGDTFTAAELFSSLKFRGGARRRSAYIKVLKTVGILQRVGKRGNAFLYSVSDDSAGISSGSIEKDR